MKKSVLRGQVLFLFGVIIGPHVCQAPNAAATIKEQTAPDMTSLVVVIQVSEFSEDNLLKLANKYLSRSERTKLLQVGFYTDSEVAHDSLGKTEYHVSYQQWRLEFERRALDKLKPAAVLLKYGDSATIRIRFADGHNSEVRIAGENVFHPVIGGLTFEILHVSFVDQGYGSEKKLTPHFYLKSTRKISPKEAEVFARDFLHVVGIPNPVIHFRQDGWFLFSTFYPWINPFSDQATPPTLEETARSVEFLCRPAEEQACFQVSPGTV